MAIAVHSATSEERWAGLSAGWGSATSPRPARTTVSPCSPGSALFARRASTVSSGGASSSPRWRKSSGATVESPESTSTTVPGRLPPRGAPREVEGGEHVDLRGLRAQARDRLAEPVEELVAVVLGGDAVAGVAGERLAARRYGPPVDVHQRDAGLVALVDGAGEHRGRGVLDGLRQARLRAVRAAGDRERQGAHRHGAGQRAPAPAAGEPAARGVLTARAAGGQRRGQQNGQQAGSAARQRWSPFGLGSGTVGVNGRISGGASSPGTTSLAGVNSG